MRSKVEGNCDYSVGEEDGLLVSDVFPTENMESESSSSMEVYSEVLEGG
jgi:hypothetical protein